MRQTEFNLLDKPVKVFGGSLLKNSHAKRKRPLDRKKPIHLVVRSQKARGAASMRHPLNFGKVNTLFNRTAEKHGVTVYHLANVGNHLHAIIRIHSRDAWARFIRELTGRLAQLLQKLKPSESAEKFWDQRPYTRIAEWGRAYKELVRYVIFNNREGDGELTHEEAKWLRAFERRLSSA